MSKGKAEVPSRENHEEAGKLKHGLLNLPTPKPSTRTAGKAEVPSRENHEDPSKLKHSLLNLSTPKPSIRTAAEIPSKEKENHEDASKFKQSLLNLSTPKPSVKTGKEVPSKEKENHEDPSKLKHGLLAPSTPKPSARTGKEIPSKERHEEANRVKHSLPNLTAPQKLSATKTGREIPSKENHDEGTKLKPTLLHTSTPVKLSGRTKKMGTPTTSKENSLQSTQRVSAASPGGQTPAPGKKKRRFQPAQPDALDYSKMKRLVEDGSILMSRYLIDGMIAGGGFGQVYLALDKVTGMKCAVKVQAVQGGKDLEKRIKLEMMLYTRLRGQNHIPLLVAACPLPNQVGIALVMQLVGRSLADVRRQMPARQLSQGTLYRAMRQVLTAIAIIHEVGFVHRDVKPPNCCLGAIDVGRIYLLDFGLCRQYIDSSGMVRKARKEAPFRGTLRYASLSGHAKQEFGPCNDLVAFLYSTVELGNAGLPWSRTAEKDKIERMKKDTSNQQLCHNQPKLLAFTEEVMSMKYSTIPDYQLLMKLFDQFEPAGLTPETPFDWEVHPCELEVKVKRVDEAMTNNTLPDKN